MQSLPRCLLIASSFILATAPLSAQDGPIEELGAGSYHATLPDGRDRPVDANGNAVLPRITAEFTGPVPSSDWSSSIVFPRYQGSQHGEAMFPWPLALKADANGLRIVANPPVQPVGNGYSSFLDPNNGGIHVGIEGLQANRTELAAQGDWTITTECRDRDRSVRATFGRGLPFVWFEVIGADVAITLPDGASVLENSDARIVIQAGGDAYAAFAPSGSSWQIDGSSARSSLGGLGHLSVAALPDTSPETIQLFQQHAHAVVVDSRVSWTVDETDGVVRIEYALETIAREGTEDRTLTGLFPHQTPHASQAGTGHVYETARGPMSLIRADVFELAVPVVPILPGLPLVAGMDQEALRSDLLAIIDESASINAPDSYWAGKQLGRVANAAHIADQLGEIEMRDELLSRLRDELENWLSVGAPATGNRIEAEAYDSAEGITIGTGEDGGTAVTGIGDGDRLRWSGIDLQGETPARVLVRFASGVASGGSALIQLRADGDDGPIIGEAAIANTGGWSSWTTVPLGVSESAAALLDGSRELVFRCDTGFGGDILSLEWIEWDLPGGAASGKSLAYHPEWSTLLAEPGSYGLAGELNDHHFHYGYFIAAAATIARFDPDWASQDRWGGMVDLLVKDPANWDRNDQRFPFLRNLDPYMGHSYASGHAGFAAGNNQESSSESMNFAQAVALWGQATGRTEISDLGVFLHALEAQAIEQYWFDVEQSVYPEFMPHPIAGIVWDAGVAYATWWTANVEEIHGINVLPLTGGSLYLARRPEAMERAWDHLVLENPGPPTVWQDILWSWRALFDPEAAKQWFETDDSWYPEAGSSRAQVRFWIESLAALGTLRADIRADTAMAAVFEDDGTRTYVAYNAGTSERSVRFSDGFTLCVGPGTLVHGVTPGSCGNPQDLDGTGTVDGADLTILLGAWGICPEDTDCLADINRDGTVDGADLTLLLGAWSTP